VLYSTLEICRDESFVEYFVEQGFHVDLVFLLAGAMVDLGAAAAASLLCGRWFEPRALRATLGAGLVVVLAAVAGITLFEAVASWYRPSGEGVTARWPVYRDRVEFAFFALYGLLVAAAAVLGWLAGRRRAPRPALVAVATAVVVVGFLTATLPFVEFLNECHTGRAIVIVGEPRC
jgi:hypothetical protein